MTVVLNPVFPAEDTPNPIASAIAPVNRDKVFPVPQSHFFTELLTQQQSAQDSFGPLGSTSQDRERKFRVTSKFALGANVTKDAYAVASGLIYIVPHGDTTDKVNVFLKPYNGCDIGVKIKFFVYRGILRTDMFSEINPQTVQMNPPDPTRAKWIRDVWDKFMEFNFPENQDPDGVVLLAEEIGFTNVQRDTNLTLNYHFKNKGSLAFINRGQLIGKFKDTIGFEVVLDHGDSELEKTESGFLLDESYVTATECIFTTSLNTSSTPAETAQPFVVGYKPGDSVVSAKIFRENVLHFMDPAAFYGAHITDVQSNIEREVGIVHYGNYVDANTTPTFYKTKADISSHILNMFANKNKVFLYIMGKRGRSYNFYSPENSLPLKINGINSPIGTNLWPIIILNSSQSQFTPQSAEIRLQFNNLDETANDLLLSKDSYQQIFFNGLNDYPGQRAAPEFILRKPQLNNQLVSGYLYVNFEPDVTDASPLENFGPITVIPIFEFQDAQSAGPKTYQWVPYLKPKLMIIKKQAYKFEQKVIFSSPQNEQNLYQQRLYLFYPKEITRAQNSAVNDPGGKKSLSSRDTAGFHSKLKVQTNMVNVRYGDTVMNFGELAFNDPDIYIWRGTAKTASNTYVPVCTLRHIRNEEISDLFYLVGITAADHTLLNNSLLDNDATTYNRYFAFDEVNLQDDPASGTADFGLKKYRLGLKYDKPDGTPGTYFPTDLFAYSIDGRFFSTPSFATSIIDTNRMAKVTVEFKLKDILEDRFGFDWMRKNPENYPAAGPYQAGTYPSFKTITGGNTTQTDNSTPSIFAFDRMMYNRLKDDYGAMPINWRLDDNDKDLEYFVPWISLAKDQTATLNLKIKVKEVPDILYINFNSSLVDISTSLSNPGNHITSEIITLADVPGYDKRLLFKQNVLTNGAVLNVDINLTCKAEFEFDHFLNVIASDKEDNGQIERLAGRIRIFRNKPIIQKLIFVPTRIKLPDNENPVQPSLNALKNSKAGVEKYLKQAGIIAQVDFLKVNANAPVDLDNQSSSNVYFLDLVNDKHFSQPFNNSEIESERRGHYVYQFANNSFINANFKPKPGSTEEEYLECLPHGYVEIRRYVKSKLEPLGFPIDSEAIYVFFMIHNARFIFSPPPATGSAIDDSLIPGGFGSPNSDSAIFTADADTVAHEALHCLGVWHTFDNDKLHKGAKFLFKAKETDNIMDYSHTATSPKPRPHTYHWQWLRAREFAEKYPRNIDDVH